MSNVINYFLGNTIYILTLTCSGNPDNHPALMEKMSPVQQWIFNDPNRAVEAAEAIYTSIDNKLRESGESELNPPVNLKETFRNTVGSGSNGISFLWTIDFSNQPTGCLSSHSRCTQR